jgi:hypothetical protein
MKANTGSGMNPNSLAIAEPDVIPCRVTKRGLVDDGLCPLRTELGGQLGGLFGCPIPASY